MNTLPLPLSSQQYQHEKLNFLQAYLFNKEHKCFQSCTPLTKNIIYSTYTFIEEEPIITVIVKCPKCNQLTYLLYTPTNYNTPIYREQWISIHFIRSFLRNYSPQPFTMSSPLYLYLLCTLDTYYLRLQIRNKKKANYTLVNDILNYCFTYTLLIQPLLFLKHLLFSSNTKRNKQIIHAILSLSTEQIHEINKIAREKY